MLPDPIQNLIVALERLPGIGPKTASRLAFYLLRAPEEVSSQLAEALTDIKTHILQGVLSPIDGIGPDDLKIRALLERIQRGGVMEVILATNPSMEGEATAQYLHPRLQALGVRVTRLARGLPVGGDLEYADQNTLLRALSGRQEME
jgi:recombination protein RecR